MNKTILITGGAGFIGSHLLHHFVKCYPNYQIINLDKLTYAANPTFIADLENFPNYTFEKVDLVDSGAVEELFHRYRIDNIIHLAAETHVDRSISGPMEFVMTNVVGSVNLLQAAKKFWLAKRCPGRFYHVSTDEVYGALGEEGSFNEESGYAPNSPYAASKASSDLFVRAYANTYGLPVVISNCSNNYGPNQHPEKLIPLVIRNICQGRPIPIYGKGNNVRDWLFVGDHVEAIDRIFHKGRRGQIYNIGAENEWRNIDLVRMLCSFMDQKLGQKEGRSQALISHVKDRLGHDERYSIDCRKIKEQLAWQAKTSFLRGLEKTIDWYLARGFTREEAVCEDQKSVLV